MISEARRQTIKYLVSHVTNVKKRQPRTNKHDKWGVISLRTKDILSWCRILVHNCSTTHEIIQWQTTHNFLKTTPLCTIVVERRKGAPELVMETVFRNKGIIQLILYFLIVSHPVLRRAAAVRFRLQQGSQ